MRTQRRSVWSAVMLAGLGCAAGGAAAEAQPVRAAQGKHAQVEVITAAEAPDASGTLWLGVRFAMELGWHIYWVNPGDSGGPPTATWTLQHGVTADGFLWPTPERIPLGPLVNYGYKGDVVLPVALRVPADARTKPIGGSVDLRWLICKEICISDRASLAFALPLPAADRGRLATWQRQVATARAAVPAPAPSSWKTAAAATRDTFVITIVTNRAVTGGTFFPLDEGVVNESAPQRVDAQGRQIRFTLKKSDHLVNTPARLRGVVAFATGEAVEVSAAVADGPASANTSKE